MTQPPAADDSCLSRIVPELSRFASCLKAASLPAEALRRAALAVTDVTGCMLAGATEPAGRLIVGHVRELGEMPSSTVVGTDVRTSPPLAALANGTLAHALDFDDTLWTYVGHVSASLWPAVLALGEPRRVSGDAGLAAYVAGVEVASALGCLGHPVQVERGWHGTGTVNTLGAAAAAGNVLGMDEGQMRNALGIAVSHAAGTQVNFGTMTKPLHAGRAARDGVTAALLAQSGFTAAPDAVTSRAGFLDLFGRSDSAEEVAKDILGNLGERFALIDPGLAFKIHAACACTHPAVDATLALREKNQWSAPDVEEVLCGLTSYARSQLPFDVPPDNLSAKFSAPYVLAVALTDGEVGLAQFTEARYADPGLQALVRRGRILDLKEFSITGEIPPTAAFVQIRARGGRSDGLYCDRPLGDPARPLSEQALVKKFEICASRTLSAGRVKSLGEMLRRFPDLRDIGELCSALCA